MKMIVATVQPTVDAVAKGAKSEAIDDGRFFVSRWTNASGCGWARKVAKLSDNLEKEPNANKENF